MDKNKFGSTVYKSKKKGGEQPKCSSIGEIRNCGVVTQLNTTQQLKWKTSATCVSMHNFFLICKVERLGWYKVI